jgi:hypothetical protein
MHPGETAGSVPLVSNIDISQKVPCGEWMSKLGCNRVKCRYAHVIPGTDDPNAKTYMVINKTQFSLRIPCNHQAGEHIISSTKGKINSKDCLVALTSESNLHIADLSTNTIIS